MKALKIKFPARPPARHRSLVVQLHSYVRGANGKMWYIPMQNFLVKAHPEYGYYGMIYLYARCPIYGSTASLKTAYEEMHDTEEDYYILIDRNPLMKLGFRNYRGKPDLNDDFLGLHGAQY